MKTFKLAAIISSVLLLGASVAQADVSYNKEVHNQNFSAKRPYQQVLPESAYNKADQWEGATLSANDAQADAGEQSIKKINLNMLGKRAYME